MKKGLNGVGCCRLKAMARSGLNFTCHLKVTRAPPDVANLDTGGKHSRMNSSNLDRRDIIDMGGYHSSRPARMWRNDNKLKAMQCFILDKLCNLENQNKGLYSER